MCLEPGRSAPGAARFFACNPAKPGTGSRATNRADARLSSGELHLHGEIDNRANGHSRGTLRKPRPALVEPACRGNIQMNPRRVICELFQEPSRRDRTAALAAA